MPTVVVVDDHPLMRQSVGRIVSSQEGFELVGEAAKADEAFAVIQRTQPDVVLLDVAMPDMDGIDLTGKLKAHNPDLRVILLTMHEDDGSLRRAMAVGADAYVPKTVPTAEVIQALKVVSEGGSYLSPSIARRMMDLASGRGFDPAVTLTERELEILRLLAAGHRSQDIADELFLSVKTVKNHLTSIYSKLNVETAAQAVAEAYRLGIATPAEGA
jgi:DNA-binding NarL/FixJ family response regulator